MGDLATALMAFGLVTFAKSQTTPIILDNEECHPPSYDMLDFCARGVHIRTWQLRQIKKLHVAVRCQPTCIVGIL